MPASGRQPRKDGVRLTITVGTRYQREHQRSDSSVSSQADVLQGANSRTMQLHRARAQRQAEKDSRVQHAERGGGRRVLRL